MSEQTKRVVEEKHGNEQIVYFDFRRLMAHSYIEMLEVAEEYIINKSDLLIIFDVSGATIFGEALQKSKKFAKKIKPHRRKSSLLGVSGAKQVLLESILFFTGVRDNIKTFDTKEEAIAWLLEK